MDIKEILILTATYLVMIVGLVFTLIPAIPGTPIIFAGILIYGILTQFSEISIFLIIILGIITVLVQIAEYFSSIYGAKKFGASKWGILGAVLGGIIGLFFSNLIGIIIGPIIGSFLLEFICSKKFKQSLKVGTGTLFGFLGGTLLKVLVGIIMILTFTFAIIF